jgi:hypothetical protein
MSAASPVPLGARNGAPRNSALRNPTIFATATKRQSSAIVRDQYARPTFQPETRAIDDGLIHRCWHSASKEAT